MDIYEDRKGFKGEPLGFFGISILASVLEQKDRITITDLLVSELKRYYTLEQINGMFAPFERLIDRINATSNEREEALTLSISRDVPRGDALHAIIARDHGLILISRDNHFKTLQDITQYHLPEEFI